MTKNNAWTEFSARAFLYLLPNDTAVYTRWYKKDPNWVVYC